MSSHGSVLDNFYADLFFRGIVFTPFPQMLFKIITTFSLVRQQWKSLVKVSTDFNAFEKNMKNESFAPLIFGTYIAHVYFQKYEIWKASRVAYIV